jgi:Na+-transporting NADH:ubiquinone oxidoreductase subunit C
MANKDTVKQTIIVALLLSITFSVVVAGTAVALKPAQQANKALDKQKNILIAAGMFNPEEQGNDDVAELFKQFTVRVADIDAGKLMSDDEVAAAGINIATFNQRSASKKAELSRGLSKDEDLASLKRRSKYALVYLVEGEQGIERIVLPVRGPGLWGPLYGFLALKGDMNSVQGLGFYEHKETPGLGGEVDNPKWKALWVDKKVFGVDDAVAISLPKGKVDASTPDAEHKVDALSGATLTSVGVENLLRFWLSDSGFGPLLKNLRG